MRLCGFELLSISVIGCMFRFGLCMVVVMVGFRCVVLVVYVGFENMSVMLSGCVLLGFLLGLLVLFGFGVFFGNGLV